MALIQAARPATGGGTIQNYAVDTHTQETNFIAGAVVIALSQTPFSATSIQVDYNGQRLLYNSAWTYAAGSITIQFADPYVTDYDTPPIFQITYPYT